MINLQPALNQAAVCQRCKEPIGSTASHCHPFGSMGRVARKLVATPKRLRLLVSRRRLAAPSPRSIRRLSKEALQDHLMNNSLDTSDTHQQMVSRLSAFSKVAKARSEDQRPESKEAPDHRPENSRGDITSTTDSSETRDPIALKDDSGYDSSEAPAKPPSKRQRKRHREHTPSTSSSRSLSQKKAP